jgi:hypothetical protein
LRRIGAMVQNAMDDRAFRILKRRLLCMIAAGRANRWFKLWGY